jgi:hypothetical protein
VVIVRQANDVTHLTTQCYLLIGSPTSSNAGLVEFLFCDIRVLGSVPHAAGRLHVFLKRTSADVKLRPQDALPLGSYLPKQASEESQMTPQER